MNENVREKVLTYFYYLLMFFLPVSLFLDNLILILMVIGVLWIGRIKYNFLGLLNTSLVLFSLFVICIGVTSFNIELQEYLKLLPLIIIPFVLSYYDKKTLSKGFLFVFIGVLVIQIVALYGITSYYLEDGKKIALRSYSGINDILRYERPYLGYFSALNIIISYNILRKRNLYYFLLASLFSLFVIIIISARLALIIAGLTIIAIIWVELKKRTYRLLVLGVISAIFVAALSFSSTPLEHRFIQIKNDTRLVIWEGVYNILSSKSYDFVLGFKGQDIIEDKLFNYYENVAIFDYPPDEDRFLRKKYNTHNQYLNELLRGGGVGLFLFIYPISFAFFYNLRKKNLFEVLLLLSLLLFCFVENLLARQIGVYTIAIILTYSRININERN